MNNCVSLCIFPRLHRSYLQKAWQCSPDEKPALEGVSTPTQKQLCIPLHSGAPESNISPWVLSPFLSVEEKPCPLKAFYRVKITARGSQQDSWVVGISKASTGNKDVLWFRVHVLSLCYPGRGDWRGFKRAG